MLKTNLLYWHKLVYHIQMSINKRVGIYCAGWHSQVPLSNSVKLAKVLGADLAILDKCGHLPMEECPNEYMAVVESFIQKCTNA